MIKSLVLASAMLLGAVGFGAAFAAPVAAQDTPAQVVVVQTTDFSGRVTKVENNKLTVVSDDITREVTVPGNVQITRNGLAAQIGDTQVGDNVKITMDGGGNVLSVDAQARVVTDTANMLLLILPVLILLAILVYWLISRGNQAKIKTAPTQVS